MEKSVVKAFKLLELLSKSDQPVGVTELSKMSSLGKSNVHRLLQTLQSLNYVRKTDDNAYEATLRNWEMGSYVFSRMDLKDVVRPYMLQLFKMTNESIHLSELVGYEVLYIDKIESQEPVRAYTQLGGRAPAYCTATGKVMLAYLSSEQIAECYQNVQKYTPKTICNIERFRIEALKIREQRYAINCGEWRVDVHGIAAPIAGKTGTVIGALGLSAPANRLHVSEMETLTPQLIKNVEKISRSLGCSEDDWAMLGANALPESVIDTNRSALDAG